MRDDRTARGSLLDRLTRPPGLTSIETPPFFHAHLAHWYLNRQPDSRPPLEGEVALDHALAAYLLEGAGDAEPPPVLLTEAITDHLGALVGSQGEITFASPVTRLMAAIWRDQERANRRFDPARAEDVADFICAFLTGWAPHLRLPDRLLPAALWDCANEAAPGIPQPPQTRFELSRAWLHLLRHAPFLAGGEEPDLSREPDRVHLLLRMLSAMGQGAVSERLLPAATRDYLVSTVGGSPVTGLMREVLSRHGVAPEDLARDPEIASQAVALFLERVLPAMRGPESVLAPHRALARARGLDQRDPAPFRPAARPNLVLAWDAPGGERHRSEAALAVVGPVDLEAGLGAAARASLEALAASAVPAEAFSRYAASRNRALDRRHAGSLVARIGAPACLLHFNANVITENLLLAGPEQFDGRFLIGNFFWETSEAGEVNRVGCDLVDEIWVATEFLGQVFSAVASVPVHVMGLSVAEHPLPGWMNRAYFRLPADRFLFLFTFDSSSRIARKNPMAVLRAFQSAFPGRDDVGLVLKAQHLEKSLPPAEADAATALISACRADRRVILINEVFRSGELRGLLAACDAYVSLHRAEGFGLGLAEAMLLGKPVIATAWSGNTDFTTPETAGLVDFRLVPVGGFAEYFSDAPGQMWADPDLDQAAAWMRRLADEPSVRARLGQAGQALIRERHSPRAVGERYAARLRELGFLR